MEKENTKAPLTEAQLTQRAIELQAGEEKLKQEIQNFEAHKERIEKANCEREEELNRKEQALQELEGDLLSSSPPPQTPEPGLKFTHNGIQYQFVDSAPKSLRYKGKVWTQLQLTKEECLIDELIHSSFIIKKI